jgi:hypothetical protein
MVGHRVIFSTANALKLAILRIANAVERNFLKIFTVCVLL